MKLLILTTIALVIPAFFVLVLAMSMVGKLTSLRNRCREIRARLQAAPAANRPTGPASDPRTHAEFNLAVERYNAARRKFPASLLAVVCGFHELEPLLDPPVDGGREPT
jgi:hypothetical protein